MRNVNRRVLIVLVLVALSARCSTEYRVTAVRDVVAPLAQTELACPETQIAVTEEEIGYYRASGCGRQAEYICGRQGCMRNPSR